MATHTYTKTATITIKSGSIAVPNFGTFTLNVGEKFSRFKITHSASSNPTVQSAKSTALTIGTYYSDASLIGWSTSRDSCWCMATSRVNMGSVTFTLTIETVDAEWKTITFTLTGEAGEGYEDFILLPKKIEPYDEIRMTCTINNNSYYMLSLYFEDSQSSESASSRARIALFRSNLEAPMLYNQNKLAGQSKFYYDFYISDGGTLTITMTYLPSGEKSRKISTNNIQVITPSFSTSDTYLLVTFPKSINNISTLWSIQYKGIIMQFPYIYPGSSEDIISSDNRVAGRSSGEYEFYENATTAMEGVQSFIMECVGDVILDNDAIVSITYSYTGNSLDSCVGYYNGRFFEPCTVNYYNGTQFIECSPYYYNGTTWVPISTT